MRLRGCLTALALLTACARQAPPPAHAAIDREVARLHAEIAQRDQTITLLEGRLALSEAGQRELRARLEGLQAAQPTPRETVRIGQKPAVAEAPEPSPPVETQQARPLLRLHAVERRGSAPELTSTWSPPVTSERLSVVPLPDARRSQPQAAAPVAPPPASAGDELYASALDLLRRREFAEAQRELEAFVNAYPGDPRVGRAQFFRGELWFAEHEYKRALTAYEQALARDPNGDKAADALLRRAMCQQRLGAPEQARATVNELRARFPNSTAAKRSDEVIQEISG